MKLVFIWILGSIGCYFLITSLVGFIRLKGLYNKILAVSLSTNIGGSFVFMAFLVHNGMNGNFGKILIIIILNIVISLTITQMLAREGCFGGVDIEAKKR